MFKTAVRKMTTIRMVYRTFGIWELYRVSIKRIFKVKHKSDNFENARINLIDSKDQLLSTNNELQQYRKRAPNLASHRRGFFDRSYDIGSNTQNLLWKTIRREQPSLVVESGVAAGVSTNLILSALKMNGVGKLVSIDITDQVGELIDINNKDHWELAVLPKFCKKKGFIDLIRRNNQIEIFFHDSDHDLSWQIFEFETVINSCPKVQMMIFDDVTSKFLQIINAQYPQIDVSVIKESNKFSGIFFLNRLIQKNENEE